MRVRIEACKTASHQRISQDQCRPVAVPRGNEAGSQSACESREKLDRGEKPGLPVVETPPADKDKQHGADYRPGHPPSDAARQQPAKQPTIPLATHRG